MLNLGFNEFWGLIYIAIVFMAKFYSIIYKASFVYELSHTFFCNISNYVFFITPNWLFLFVILLLFFTLVFLRNFTPTFPNFYFILKDFAYFDRLFFNHTLILQYLNQVLFEGVLPFWNIFLSGYFSVVLIVSQRFRIYDNILWFF